MDDAALFKKFVTEGRLVDETYGRKTYQWGKAQLVHWFHPLSEYRKVLMTRFHCRNLNA